MLIGTYGSLKKGFHNHSWLKMSKQVRKDKILGIMQIPGSYPHLFHKNEIKTKEIEIEHELEIYNIDIDIFNSIASAERSCGYKQETIKTNLGNVQVFYSLPIMFNENTKIALAYTKAVYLKNK